MNDFSRYDRVMVPVMIFSGELNLIYANAVAARNYPLLTSPNGMSFYCNEEELASISDSLKNGQVVSLPLESEIDGRFIFDPVFASDGSLSHVQVYLGGGFPLQNTFASLSDREIIEILNREITYPVGDLLHVMNRLKGQSSAPLDPELKQTLSVMYDRLIRISLSLSRMEDSASNAEFAICDADAALRSCSESFSSMKYGAQSRCFIPMERNCFMHLMTDILSSLFFCQTPGEKINVTLVQQTDSVDIVLRSGHLAFVPGPNFLMEQDPLCGNYFSVRSRIEGAGGVLDVRIKPASETVTVTISLPPVCYELGQIRVEDAELDVFSEDDFYSPDFFEYMSLLSQKSGAF